MTGMFSPAASTNVMTGSGSGGRSGNRRAKDSNRRNHGNRPFPIWFEGSPATHQVARAIMQYGPITRTTLGQVLGLSQGALSRITSDLIYYGVIEELPDSATAGRLPRGMHLRETMERRGRPQTALRIRADEHTFLGANIHDQSITVSQVDTLCRELGTPVTEHLESIEPLAVARQLAHVCERCMDPGIPAPTALGIAVGGHVDGDRIVTYAPFLHWNGAIDFGTFAEQSTGLPVKVFNDLDSLLVYEGWFGDAVGASRFAVLTMGAGVGYSLAVDGNLVDYPDRSYGLSGHILIDPEGPRCSEGHVGCAQCLTSDSIAEEYSALTGHMMNFEEFTADLRSNNPLARRLGERTGYRLGVLIAMVENLAMPELVVISGESSFIAQMNVESIRKGIDSYRHSQASLIPFIMPDFTWRMWSDAAAARVIAHFVED